MAFSSITALRLLRAADRGWRCVTTAVSVSQDGKENEGWQRGRRLAQLSPSSNRRLCPSVWPLSWGQGRHQAGGVCGRHT